MEWDGKGRNFTHNGQPEGKGATKFVLHAIRRSVRNVQQKARMEIAYQPADWPPETPPANQVSTQREHGFEPGLTIA
jgi:hypothetical protein